MLSTTTGRLLVEAVATDTGARPLLGGCPQRVAVIEIRARTPNLPVSDDENSAHRGFDRNAAAASASLNPTEPDDALAEIANLPGDESDLLPGRVKRLEVGLDAIASTEAVALDGRAESGGPLEVGGCRCTNASTSRRLNAAITSSTSSTFPATRPTPPGPRL